MNCTCCKLHTPKSEEKSYKDSVGGVVEAFAQGYKPTPPSEEKKCCEQCAGQSIFNGPVGCAGSNCPCHSPTQEEKRCGLCSGCHQGKECHGSPTPPDAWEEEFRSKFVVGEYDLVEQDVDCPWEAKDILKWLRSKKKEWEKYQHDLTKATEKLAFLPKLRAAKEEARTTTLEEVERVVEEKFIENPTPNGIWYNKALADVMLDLSRLKEMRTK